MTEKKSIRFLNSSSNNTPFSSTNINDVNNIENTKEPTIYTKEKGLAIHNEETCYFLLWEIQNNHIPQEKNTRIKFGFNKCTTQTHEWYLYQIYHDYFFKTDSSIFFPKKVYYLHQAYLKDKLFEFLIETTQQYNLYTNHFKWFHDNPNITKQLTQDYVNIEFD